MLLVVVGNWSHHSVDPCHSCWHLLFVLGCCGSLMILVLGFIMVSSFIDSHL
ncbi:hypothetical protein CAAN4_D04038 [[Candida] anglica]|uniref:NADH dehydrogenase subunit 6 n=1 Tax=[Candida] anglica TaxID=148631 RepID=A0ABP0EDY7_9ASCO